MLTTLSLQLLLLFLVWTSINGRMWEQQENTVVQTQNSIFSKILRQKSNYGHSLTACACLMKSRMSSLRAWWILAGPLSSHRQTAWTSLWEKKEDGRCWRNSLLTNLFLFAFDINVSRCITVNLREQVKPLLFGDGLLPQQLQYYGTHQVPFVLKLKGAFVL